MISKKRSVDFPTIEEAVRGYSFISLYDFKEAQKKELAEVQNFSEMYLQLQMIYKAALMKYLTEVLMLDEYDQTLKESRLKFLPIHQDKQNIYQKYGNNGLLYIYLRNNLYIEKLDSRELEQLLKNVNDDEDYSDYLKDLVIQTYKIVITADSPNELEEKVSLIYNNWGTGMNAAPNDALILEIGTRSAFDTKGNYVNLENESKKKTELEKLRKEIEEMAKGILKIPVVVFLRRE